MKKLSRIFAMAVALSVMTFTSACAQETDQPRASAPAQVDTAETTPEVVNTGPALKVGQGGTPAQVGQAITAEGHKTAFRYNNVLYPQGKKAYQRNLVTVDQNMNWYLIVADAPLNQNASVMQIELKGTDLQFYELDYDSPLVPASAFGPEDLDHIQAFRDAGKERVSSRSLMISNLLKSKASLSFSGIVRNNEGKVLGQIDAVTTDVNGQHDILTIIFSDSKGAAYVIKSGEDFELEQKTLTEFAISPIDLDKSAETPQEVAHVSREKPVYIPN